MAQAKNRKSVDTTMIKEAVVALFERNGSSVKSIFNYLVKTKKVRPSARAQVSLSIGRALKTGVLVKKQPNTFVVPAGKVSSSKKVTKSHKRKNRRVKRKSVKKVAKRRRRSAGRKRKVLKKRAPSKKRSRVVRRKSQKKRRVAQKNRVQTIKSSEPIRRNTRRAQRRAAHGKRYSA